MHASELKLYRVKLGDYAKSAFFTQLSAFGDPQRIHNLFWLGMQLCVDVTLSSEEVVHLKLKFKDSEITFIPFDSESEGTLVVG